MPFRSQAQRAWMYSTHPKMARRWEEHTPKGTKLPEHVKGMEKLLKELSKIDFTTRQGKVESHSEKQHRYLHAHKLPHTHIEGNKRVRENFGKVVYPDEDLLMNREVQWELDRIYQEYVTGKINEREFQREVDAIRMKKEGGGGGGAVSSGTAGVANAVYSNRQKKTKPKEEDDEDYDERYEDFRRSFDRLSKQLEFYKMHRYADSKERAAEMADKLQSEGWAVSVGTSPVSGGMYRGKWDIEFRLPSVGQAKKPYVPKPPSRSTLDAYKSIGSLFKELSEFGKISASEMRERAIEAYGGHCALCGKKSNNLQFAHVLPTGLSGMGRGSRERALDVRRNPYSYVLLCPSCHKKFDTKH